jgi:hypothetical protein
MLTFLKYLPQILLGFKDVSDKYKQETGSGRPWYLSRTFIFSALCFLGTGITIITGISFEQEQIKVVADNAVTIITAVISIIGAILSFVAQWKSKKNTSTN